MTTLRDMQAQLAAWCAKHPEIVAFWRDQVVASSESAAELKKVMSGAPRWAENLPRDETHLGYSLPEERYRK